MNGGVLKHARFWSSLQTSLLRKPPNTSGGTTPLSKVWPFQEAVMFLEREPWRACFCEWCKKKYVAEQKGRRYCSSGFEGSCASEARRNDQNVYFREKGADKRRERKARKAKRVSRSGRGRT